MDRSSPEFKASWNTLVNNARVYTPEGDPDAQFRHAISSVGADLRAEPLVFTVPEVEKRRYYSLQLSTTRTDIARLYRPRADILNGIGSSRKLSRNVADEIEEQLDRLRKAKLTLLGLASLIHTVALAGNKQYLDCGPGHEDGGRV